MIDFQHLRVFIQVAELKSFTKAAVVFGVSQPTISRLIKEMEEQWEGQLFYRTGRGANLSEFGEMALARARTLVRDADQVSEELRARSRLPSGDVSLALPFSMVAPVVPRLVNQLRRDLPGIRLTIYEGFGGQLERWLSTGEVEIGLYSVYREGESFHDMPLLPSRLILAVPAGVATLPPETSFADLVNYPLVLPPMPHGLRIILESISRRLRVSLNAVVDAGSVVAQKLICEHSGCYMIKSPHSIADEQASGLYSTSLIVEPIIQRYAVLVTTRQRPVSRAAREVASRVTAILRSLSR